MFSLIHIMFYNPLLSYSFSGFSSYKICHFILISWDLTVFPFVCVCVCVCVGGGGGGGGA
jgi:hypothetical protein